MQKATKAKVTIGNIEVDGYLLDDGTFGLSLSDVCRMIEWDIRRGSDILKNKWVKKLAEKGFQGSERVTHSDGKASILALDWVPSVLQGLARSGNDEAWTFLDSIAGVMLQKLFSDAFGIQFESEEIQEHLRIRLQGIEKRNKWTDAIKAYGDTHEVSDNWRGFIYANVSDCLNQGLTGQKAKYWREKFDCDASHLRDNWAHSHLANIDRVEFVATRMVEAEGMEPLAAMKAAIIFCNIPVNTNPERTISEDAFRKRRERGSKLPHAA